MQLTVTSVSLVSLCLLDTLVSPAETAEPIEITFGGQICVGPRNHVLDGVHIDVSCSSLYNLVAKIVHLSAMK